MQEKAFAAWLRDRGHKTTTAFTDAKRIEKAFGDLDNCYNKDCLSYVISRLEYSRTDERNRRLNDSGIDFDPRVPSTDSQYFRRIYQNFSSYKSVAKRYVEFRKELASRPPALSAQDADAGPFNPANTSDGRARTFQSVVVRRGQQQFRDELRRAYNDACTISGCTVLDVLEAAHIVPYSGDETNHVTNGLLLRADLHTLFDCGLIAIDPATLLVVVKVCLLQSEYGQFSGCPIRVPHSASSAPSREALEVHMRTFHGTHMADR